METTFDASKLTLAFSLRNQTKLN